jgi:hypothetical protein
VTESAEPDSNAAALRDALDAGRREQAAEQRSEQRSQIDRLGEQTSFLGVALELAEGGAELALSLRDGRLHHGQLEIVGPDFVVVRIGVGARIAVPRNAITSIRHSGRPVLGTRSPAASTTLHTFLSDLMAERSEVRLRLLGSDSPFGGELAHVGVDALVIFTSGQPGTTATVPFDGLAELVLVG